MLHRLHTVQPITTDVARIVYIAWSISVLGTQVSCAEKAEPIEMPFGGLTRGTKEPCVRWGQDLI